ncbi:flavodoxin [Sphingorhabdus lutea]|uniref:Flavodoxin n=1 Tax=Sphingorhabdus lutea TaxID=1913578 RepID=A0A1L3J9S5_9SPHN|nr:NAD(P)H-dependent oxidoreductase [Sphingorhabdus lutea]APG61870.1 flavodoxin [Sphingorhabdus lutea]
MANLLIIWDSMTGGSKAMAKAAYDAAIEAAKDAANQEDGTSVKIIHAANICVDDMMRTDGYLFVCPENLAAMSGVMKAMFDRLYYPCLDEIQGRAYAMMICAGSDGSNAVRQIERICTGWRLRAVANPIIICTNIQDKKTILAPKKLDKPTLAPCRDLGCRMAAGLALGIF